MCLKSTTRRLFLTSVAVSLAGCSMPSRNNTAQASIQDAEAYLVEPDQLVALVDIAKPEGEEVQVTLRWSLATEDYTQASVTTFVIESDTAGQYVSVRLNSPTEIDPDNVTRSEIKIVRHNAADSEWVSAPLN